MDNRDGLTLVELVSAATLGVITMFAIIAITITMISMQISANNRIIADMDWLVADAHLKKNIHASAYALKPDNNTLELYDANGGLTGTYSTSGGHLIYSAGMDSLEFNYVNMTSTAVTAPGGKIKEVKIDYTEPFASVAYITCACDAKDTWAMTYGPPNENIHVTGVIAASDGGFVMFGIHERATGQCLFLLKVNTSGMLEWAMDYQGGYTYSGAEHVSQTSDGGYIIVGEAVAGTRGLDIYLIKTDSNGVSQWARQYDYNSNPDFAYSVRQTLDGGYIMCGSTLGSISIVLKVDGTGELQWSHSYGPGQLYTYTCSQAQDGGYMLSGYNPGPFVHPVMFKTDSAGVVQWSRTYFNGGINPEYGYGAVLDGGGYALVTTSVPGGLCVYRTNSAGVRQSSRRYTGTPWTLEPSSIFSTSDGGLLLGGRAINGSLEKIFIVKTDSSNTAEWARTYDCEGGWNVPPLYPAVQASEGSFVVSGRYTVAGAPLLGSNRGMILKTDAGGACPEMANPVYDGSAFGTDSRVPGARSFSPTSRSAATVNDISTADQQALNLVSG